MKKLKKNSQPSSPLRFRGTLPDSRALWPSPRLETVWGPFSALWLLRLEMALSPHLSPYLLTLLGFPPFPFGIFSILLYYYITHTHTHSLSLPHHFLFFSLSLPSPRALSLQLSLSPLKVTHTTNHHHHHMDVQPRKPQAMLVLHHDSHGAPFSDELRRVS